MSETGRACAAGYEQLYKKHRSRLLGVYARFYQARCLQKLGDDEQAQKIFQELLRMPGDSDAVQKLKATVRERLDGAKGGDGVIDQ